MDGRKDMVKTPGIGPVNERPVDKLKAAFNDPTLGERLIQGMIRYHNAWEKAMEGSTGKPTMEELRVAWDLKLEECCIRKLQTDDHFPLKGLQLVSYHDACYTNAIL